MNALQKRLAKLTPPAPRLSSYTAPEIDPATLARMRGYLEGMFIAEPGTPEPVARAMHDFLAGQ